MALSAPDTSTHALVRKPIPPAFSLSDRIADSEFRLGFWRMCDHYGHDVAAARIGILIAEVLNKQQVNSLIRTLVSLQPSTETLRFQS